MIIVVLAYRISILKAPAQPDASIASRPEEESSPISFVGARACASCHASEYQAWEGSHHQLAMQPANDSTVLGDFNGLHFTRAGITSRFYRRDGKFVVSTDGPDGANHDYQVKFTFGASPLQQYLIEFPGGRLQALGIAWDSRPRDRGGQRWFDLYPGQTISYRDPLHWTGIEQNWNFMCADCHSTNVRKNYNLRTRTYATTYAEINVACEACHGPASRHVAWARGARGWLNSADRNKGLLIALDERKNANWRIDPVSGNARRGVARASEREIQMCARCHSRRAQIHEDYVHGQPVGDDYRVSILDEDLYFPDGQIKGEVYEYGSFIQSRMFHAGVTCSDCHEPHSLKLRAQGNGVCLQCHAAGKYDSPAHHFHRAGSPGARCVECHMPTTTYMVVDPRRDHSIRIPRPELSVKLGTPNACNKCHMDKAAAWAASTVQKWYGHTPSGYQQFAQTLYAGQIGAPGAAEMLSELAADRGQPAIARASALALINRYADIDAASAARLGAGDSHPLVRRAAASAMTNSEPAQRARTIGALTADPVRAVRIEAAQVLAGVPADTLPAGDSAPLARAIDDYIAAQQLNADRPESHLNLALLYARTNQPKKAQDELKIALSLDPSFVPAAVNLADLDRELGRDADGEKVLREAIARVPADASLRLSLGLLLIRQGHKSEALPYLADASRLDPGNARFAYIYAVALYGAGRNKDAIGVLEQEIEKHPYDRDALAALASFYRDAGNPRQALAYADRLAQLEPDNPQVQQLLSQLRTAAQR
ncbi:MAG: tetratricopeptide repeat protein [Candidatus Binataceae bacterium]